LKVYKFFILLLKYRLAAVAINNGNLVCL